MFFNAHAYYSSKRSLGRPQPLRILGAIIADSEPTGVIGWQDFHDKTTAQNFAKSMGNDGIDIGLGLADHLELDSKTHDMYEGGKGYAFSHQTPELRKLVARACGIKSAGKTEGLAHNFIESGVDINLLRHDSSVQATLRSALSQIDSKEVAEHLSSFFDLEKAKTEASLNMFIDLTTKYDLQNIDDWVALWAEIAELLLDKALDRQTARHALTMAADLTASDYKRVITP